MQKCSDRSRLPDCQSGCLKQLQEPAQYAHFMTCCFQWYSEDLKPLLMPLQCFVNMQGLLRHLSSLIAGLWRPD